MYNHTIVLIHRVLVSLFLLQYIIKLVLLLANKKTELASYTKATRIVEMLVSVGFLVTGGWLLIYLPNVTALMIVKLVCVFTAIPVAIIGFKRGNKALAALSVILILAAYGLAEVNKKKQGEVKVDTSSSTDPLEIGKITYQNAGCMSCHGADGKLGASGAKDLSVTMLPIDDQKAIIRNGKSPMPGYKDLTDEQLNDLVEYIGTFKKPAY